MKKFFSIIATILIVYSANAQRSTHGFSIYDPSEGKQKALSQLDSKSAFVGNVYGMLPKNELLTSTLDFEENHSEEFKNGTFDQNSLIQIYDSIYYWTWDTINIRWEITNRTINIVYDNSYNQTSRLNQKWDGLNWVDETKNIFTFDLNNNRISSLTQYWNGNDWNDNTLFAYTFDSNNNMTSVVTKYWNGINLENHTKTTYTYDANNNRISYLWQEWNGIDWENYKKYIYTYAANNNMTDYIIQNWSGSSWEDYNIYTNSFDANNNKISSLGKSWNGSTWENDRLYTYTYDASHNLTSNLLQNWEGMNWINYILITKSFDVNNNTINELYQFWNGSAWVNYIQWIDTFDENSFWISDLTKEWNEEGSAIVYIDSTHFYSHAVLTGFNDIFKTGVGITVYPNPSSDKITIKTPAVSQNYAKLTISNLNGQQLITRQLTLQKTEIDVNTLPNGVYFIQIVQDKDIQVCKFLKQ